MATRSTIAVKQADGTIKGIYCHWDGYPSHNGKILVEHYNTQELAEKLIAPGFLSSLAPSCDKPAGHTFEEPVEGHSVYYGRDRGETNVDPFVFPTHAGLVKAQGQEYDYLWDGSQWIEAQYGPVSDILAKEEA